MRIDRTKMEIEVCDNPLNRKTITSLELDDIMQKAIEDEQCDLQY